jgi:hypothetical protein
MPNSVLMGANDRASERGDCATAGRLPTVRGVDLGCALARLYAAARLHTNLFQPSFKLKEKRRIGARVVKRYHAPAPPMTRVLAHPEVGEKRKKLLRQLHAQANPVTLLAEMRAAQAELGERVDQRGTEPAGQPIVVDLDRFAANLKIAWSEGERRPRIGALIAAASRSRGGRQYSMMCRIRFRHGSTASRRSRLWRSWRLKETHPERFTDQHLRMIRYSRLASQPRRCLVLVCLHERAFGGPANTERKSRRCPVNPD